MKNRMLKCWLLILTAALLLGMVGNAKLMAQCHLSFTGPNGNVLSSYMVSYPNYPNSPATFNTTVQGNSQPLAAGTYLTWCVDAYTLLDPSLNFTVGGSSYIGNLFPTCDPSLNTEIPLDHPATCYVSPAVWQQVNYILNHKGSAYFWDIQTAINTLVGGPALPDNAGYPPYTPANVSSLLADASNNAATWVPQCGNVIGAMYVITNQNSVALTVPVQFVILEVPFTQLTFTKVPASTNLGCNPPLANIPSAANASNTNIIYAVSCTSVPASITATQSDTTNGCQTTRLITFVASDSNGNSITNIQTITWTADTTAPVILSSPASMDLGCNPKTLPTDASIKGLVSASEGCSTATVNVSHVDSGSACGYLRTFNIIVSDACSNVSPAKTVVYTWKVDTTQPVITSIPAGGSLGCNPATLPSDAFVQSLVMATDNCSLISTNVSHLDSTNNCIITRTFTVTVTDGCGNVSLPSTVVYTWTADKIGPVIICPADYTVTSMTGTYCTYRREDYGAVCNGTNGASCLTNWFAKCYTNGWSFCGVVNNSSDYCIKFTSGTCAQKFVSCSSAPSCLKNNYTNPTSCESGLLASHATCLKFNVDFSDCGDKTGIAKGYGDLILNDPTCALHGKTVRQILDICHTAVGGGDISSYKCNYNDLTTVCSNLNCAYVNKTPSAWCSNHLVSPTVTNVPPSVSGYAGVSDKCGSTPTLTYNDVTTAGSCTGTWVIQRTWTAVDACGNTNTCTQNIYIGAAHNSSVSGTVYGDLYGQCFLTCVGNQAGISNVTVQLFNSNSVLIATVKTDIHGDYSFTNLLAGTYGILVVQPTNCVQTAGTHCLHWIDCNTNECWTENDNYLHHKGCDGVDRWTDSTGCQHYKNTAGQDCWTDKSGYCHATNCTYTSCNIPKNNIEVFTLGNCQSLTCVNFSYAGCASKCSVSVSGPSRCWSWDCVNYTCSVTNTGNTCLNSCIINACGNSYNCPSLKPGESCNVTCTTCPAWNCCNGWSCNGYNSGNNYCCQASFCGKPPVINNNCTGQATCYTSVFSSW